jgi:hypothetical protein
MEIMRFIVSICDHAPAIIEIMRFIASVSDDTPAGIVMAGTAGKVIATAVVVEVGIAWAGVDCSPCTDYLPCIDYFICAFFGCLVIV